MYFADFLIAQRVIIDATAFFAVDDANVSAKSGLIRKFEPERRVVENGLAVKGGRIEELAALLTR